MSTNLILLILMIIADLVLFIEVLYFIFRRNISNKLIQAAFEGNTEKYDKLSHSLFGKLLSTYDLKLIQYNVADIRKDYPKKEALIKDFEKMSLSKRQMKQIYPRIFYHYIDRGRKDDARLWYNKLSAFNVFSNKKDVDMTYDAYVAGGHKYLEELERSLPKTNKQELPAKERLLAKMYENKGINAEAKKYNRLAERHEDELKRRK